jgi:hypothetical protein
VNRTLPNPFYYDDRSERDEARALQRMLLAEMASASRPLILLHADPEIVALAESTGAPGLRARPLPSWREFPHRARLGHMSRSGNALVARAFLEALIGRARGASALAFETLPPEALEVAAPSPRATVSSFDRIELQSGNTVIGEITSASLSHWERGRGDPSQFARTAQRALLFVGPLGSAATDAAILPLEREAAAGAELTLIAAGAAPRALAQLKALSARIAIDWAEIPGIEFRDHQELRWSDPAPSAAPTTAASIEIRLGDRPLLRSASDDPARLVPVFGALQQITATSALAPPRAGDVESGTWELVLRRGRDAERVELGRWRTRPIRVSATPPSLFPEAAR